MKIFKFMAVALVALLGLTACEKDCDHDFIAEDYNKTILGTWSFDSETFDEDIVFYADGKFSALNYIANETSLVNGTWTLNRNRLVLTTDEGATHFSGTISVYAEEVMLMTGEGSKDARVYYYYVPQSLPKALVGTWTCLEADFAEALTIHEDGSLVSTRLDGGQYWEDMEGEFMAEVDNSYGISLNDDYDFGKFEVVSGEILALIDPATNTRRTYRYCKEDLSDEVVGMWVCNESASDNGKAMYIMTYNQDGTAVFTGASTMRDDYLLTMNYTYKVVGDLLIRIVPEEDLFDNIRQYTPSRLTYSPNGTSLGDILSLKDYVETDGGTVAESTASFLRIHQDLSLAGKSYDYSSLYVSNVKGEDKDISFMGYTMNLATMDGSGIDKMLKAILFHFEFPDADTLSYTYSIGNNQETYSAPIEVEGNKFTVKMSKKVSTLKDVVFYAFQDAEDNQMHLYMHRDAFVNFYTNMQAMLMIVENPQFDITNAEAVDAIYNNINDAVESINLSIIMK